MREAIRSGIEGGMRFEPFRSLALALLILAVLLVGLSSEGATQSSGRFYYVATTGNNNNPGTKAAPFRTITKGASVLQPGDTLYVRRGTYAESFYDNIPGGTSWAAPVRLAAFPGETVTIKPGASANAPWVFLFESSKSRYIVIDGFVVDAANVNLQAVKITYNGNEAAHHIRLMDSEVENSPGSGILVTGEPGKSAEYNKFINLDVHDNGATDFHHGIYIAANNNVVRGSRVYRNAGWGVHVYNEPPGQRTDNNSIHGNKIYDNARVGGRGPGIILAYGSGNTAYNNLIWGNNGGIQIDYGASGSKVYNNTVYANNPVNGSSYGIYVGSESSNATLKNNVVYQNDRGEIIDEGIGTTPVNNLITNPLFVDAAASDFHLRPSSPAIDAGTTVSGVRRDFEGVSRPQCAAYDIGAYEYKGCP